LIAGIRQFTSLTRQLLCPGLKLIKRPNKLLSMTKRKPSAAAPKPRRPGRPTAAASVDQRERTLDAAIAIFSERGIAATSLRAIATAAHVTPALLHYYFKTKDSLVETLLTERIAPFVAVSAAPLLAPLPSPRATLRKFLETHMRNLAAHPWMPRLMAREVLSDGGSLREHMQAQFSAVLSPKTLMLIVAAQKKGEIRTDLNPLLIGVSLISLAVFPFAAAPVWQAVARSLGSAMQLGESMSILRASAGAPPLLDPPGAEMLINHTLALFDSALEPVHEKKKR
jgi:TetR/AcrR family transcriptional regulator